MYLLSGSKTRLNFSNPFRNEHLRRRRKICAELHSNQLNSFGKTTVNLKKKQVVGLWIRNPKNF